jgi:hypothetical protein
MPPTAFFRAGSSLLSSSCRIPDIRAATSLCGMANFCTCQVSTGVPMCGGASNMPVQLEGSRDRTNLCVIWDLSRSKIYSVGHNRGAARDSRRRILPGDVAAITLPQRQRRVGPNYRPRRRVATTKSSNSFHGRRAAAGVRHRLLARIGDSAHEMGQHLFAAIARIVQDVFDTIDRSCIMCEDLAQDGGEAWHCCSQHADRLVSER